MGEVSQHLADLIGTVDSSGIVEQVQLNEERGDYVVRCASGKKHHVRLTLARENLRNEIWGYKALLAGGVPCREIEKIVEPCDEFPDGCLVVAWVEGVGASDLFEREGQNDKTMRLCTELGRALHALHSTEVTIDIPSYMGRSDRQNLLTYGSGKAHYLREAGLIDAAFERKFVALVEELAVRVPEPCPNTLHFGDMHFNNILVDDGSTPSVLAFIDLAEVGVGWPMWDFTNWERWELLYVHPWVRDPVLEAYGPLDMEMYRLAVMIRFSESHDLFAGPIGEQIVRAVDSGDPMAFDLDKLFVG